MAEPMLKDCWYVAGWSDELADDALLDRTVAGERLVFFRTADGDAVALSNRCPHRAVPLSLGRREGNGLRCGYHGMLFDADGRCLEIPGQDLVPPAACVRRFPVAERHGLIWVWPGDATLADPAAIPAVTGPDNPAWQTRTGYVHYRADAALLRDNLLDFSHLAFVHAQSFGGARWADRPEVKRIADGLLIERWMPDAPPPPFAKRAFPDAPHQDVLNVTEFLIPGVLRIEGWVQTAGAGPREAITSEGDHFLSWQAVTPETDASAHYFFTQSMPVTAPPEALEGIYQAALMAFEEDRLMIEAQQAALSATPDLPISQVATMSDGALVQMRAMIRKRVAEEQRRAGASANQVQSGWPASQSAPRA